MREQLDYDTSVEVESINIMLLTLNFEQIEIFRVVDDSTNSGCIFMYGSSNTGKAYLCKAIIVVLRSKEKIVVWS